MWSVAGLYRSARAHLARTLHRRENAQLLAQLHGEEHPRAATLAEILAGHSPWSEDEEADLAAIEQQRTELLRRATPLVDGSLPGDPMPGEEDLDVNQAAWASKGRLQARFIYRMVRVLQPRLVLELGSNVGISSAYVSAALEHNGDGGRVVTLEGSPYRMRLARSLHDRTGRCAVEYVQGRFADTLTATLSGIATNAQAIDLAFIDGFHQELPTLDYFDQIARAAAQHAAFLFDDIRHSTGMRRAWSRLQPDPRLGLTVDLGVMGLGFGVGNETDRVILPEYHLF